MASIHVTAGVTRLKSSRYAPPSNPFLPSGSRQFEPFLTPSQAFPKFRFEENFNEADELWSPTLRETDSSIDVRTKTALDDIFATDANTWISISSHSGAIASMLRVLGHRKFGLGTGQVIPVLVKAEMVKGVEPIVTPEPWQPIDLCDFPPVVGGF